MEHISFIPPQCLKRMFNSERQVFSYLYMYVLRFSVLITETMVINTVTGT